LGEREPPGFADCRQSSTQITQPGCRGFRYLTSHLFVFGDARFDEFARIARDPLAGHSTQEQAGVT